DSSLRRAIARALLRFARNDASCDSAYSDAHVKKLRRASASRVGNAVTFLRVRFRYRPAASDIFLAVDRSHMRRISIEIGPPDSKPLPVRIDPLPEAFAGKLPLRAGRAVDAHDIGGKPVAVAAAEAAAVIRSVTGRLETARDRLAIVISECAGDAG